MFGNEESIILINLNLWVFIEFELHKKSRAMFKYYLHMKRDNLIVQMNLNVVQNTIELF